MREISSTLHTRVADFHCNITRNNTRQAGVRVLPLRGPRTWVNRVPLSADEITSVHPSSLLKTLVCHARDLRKQCSDSWRRLWERHALDSRFRRPHLNQATGHQPLLTGLSTDLQLRRARFDSDLSSSRLTCRFPARPSALSTRASIWRSATSGSTPLGRACCASQARLLRRNLHRQRRHQAPTLTLTRATRQSIKKTTTITRLNQRSPSTTTRHALLAIRPTPLTFVWQDQRAPLAARRDERSE